MQIGLPAVQTRQPIGTARINWANPLTRGLVALVDGQGRCNLINGGALAVTNMTQGGANGLWGLQHVSGSTQWANAPYKRPATLSSMSCFMLADYLGTIGANNFLFGDVQAAGTDYNWGLYSNSANFLAFVKNGSGTGVNAQGSSTPSNGNWRRNHRLAMTYDGATIRIFQDGVQTGSNSQTGNVQGNALGLNINRWNNGNSDHTQNFYAGAVWNRVLSATEIASLSANPWQLFAPVGSRSAVWALSTAGGGAAALSATAAAVATLTGDVTTGIPLQAATISIASSAAALSTSIALAAGASGVSNSIATLSTGIALASSAVATSSASAALSTGIPLLGASAASASASAALSTGITLAASTGALVSASAALSTGVVLASASVCTATATAALTTSPAGLGAAAAANATAAASLTTQIRLQASATASASGTAMLAAGSSALAAMAIAQASASAALTTGIALAAISQASATSAAALSTGIRLNASAQATATAAAAFSSMAAGTPGYIALAAGRSWSAAADGRKWSASAPGRRWVATEPQ